MLKAVSRSGRLKLIVDLKEHGNGVKGDLASTGKVIAFLAVRRVHNRSFVRKEESVSGWIEGERKNGATQKLARSGLGVKSMFLKKRGFV
ncbi:hypothetical protein [Vibrio ouci]|uniref:Uncharacterized protein n=1 Tax=Vibrio ouci TaxID=2499078 RepID=A0A4Y8W9M3_9VIBR|nr:hypothetical protein [Vibrio ouci]TFH89346.1 hypothetical protein ELS82_22770 [Vibrio ouci]